MFRMSTSQVSVELGLNGASDPQVPADTSHVGTLLRCFVPQRVDVLFSVCWLEPTATRRHRQLSQHPLQGDSGRKVAVWEEGHDQRHPRRPEVSPKSGRLLRLNEKSLRSDHAVHIYPDET